MKRAPRFPQGFKHVTYLTSWAGEVDAIPFDKLTHINYAFLQYDAEGAITLPNPAKLRALVSAAHEHGVQVLISAGGWKGGPIDEVMERLAASPQARASFVAATTALVEEYALDGIDIDWEYPQPQSAANYTALMRGLRAGLDRRFPSTHKLLTAAVVSDNQGEWYAEGIQPEAYQHLDFVCIMAYDGGIEPHANYGWSVASFRFWVGRGLPAAKAVLGVPFYSRPGERPYRELVAEDPANAWRDCLEHDCYNGIPTIQRKARYVVEHGGGGIMHWEISHDAPGELSLVSAIYEELMRAGHEVPR